MRKIVESTIADHYKSTGKNLQISVHSASITTGGIQVRGVSIVDPQADGPNAELAYLDELFLVCQTDLKTLLHGKPPITEVVARAPRFGPRIDRTAPGAPADCSRCRSSATSRP